MASSNQKAVVDFLEAAANDPALQKMLQEAKDMESVVKIGQERGFGFSAADFEAIASATVSNDGELSDDDLDGVAGGTTFQQRVTDSNSLEDANLQNLNSTQKSSAGTSKRSSISQKNHALATSIISNMK